MPPLPNDMTRIVGEMSKLAGSSPDYTGNPKLAAITLIRDSILLPTASVLANGSNNIVPNAAANRRMLCNGRILGASFMPQGAVAAAGPNNATIAVKTIFANGVVNLTVASATTNTSGANGGTGNLVAGVATPLTVTDLANTRFTAGTVIGPSIVQNASGVAIPAGTLQVDVEWEAADGIYPLPPA
jgi:hypothetical protein